MIIVIVFVLDVVDLWCLVFWCIFWLVIGVVVFFVLCVMLIFFGVWVVMVDDIVVMFNGYIDIIV